MPDVGHRLSLPALALPIAAFLAVNAGAVRSWWIRDDPCLLDAALRHGAAAHFVDPATWRALSGSVLMPWTPFSLGLDHALFGLDPAFFYAHQLLAFCVLLALGYAVARTFAGRLASSAALTVFAVASPSFAVARQLMNRHYLEGLVLVLGAFLLYRRALLRERLGYAVGGAVLYALAMTAKEVFVPLVVLLPLVPLGTWRERLRTTLPFALAAAFYVPWRVYMLGPSNVLSGYVPSGLEGSAKHVLAAAGLEAPWRLALTVLVTAAALFLLRHSRSTLTLAAASALVLLGPLLGLAALNVAPRHFFLPTFAFALLLAAALERLKSFEAATAAVLLAVFSVSNLVASPVRRDYETVVQRYRVEGEFLLENDGGGVLLTGLSDTGYLRCLAEIRENVLGEDAPAFCGDPCWCSSERTGGEVYRVADGEVVPAAPAPASCAEERPFDVDLRYDLERGRLAWRFTSPDGGDGRWSVLLVTPEGTSIPVPLAASGEIPLALPPDLRIVVRYRSPEGWTAYSPELVPDAP